MLAASAWPLLFAAGVAVSLGASWLLVSRLERLGERAGFSEAWLGLVAALAADAPEITSAVTALARGQASVGAGVVIGSNVFNLAALLGLAAVVAGRIAFHRRVVLLAGVPGRGLGRTSGTAILAGYLAYVSALAVSVMHGRLGPAAVVLPAAIAAGALPLMHAAHQAGLIRRGAASLDNTWRRRSLLPGWSVGRVWGLSLILCVVIAACDAASGPHLLLIGLLIAGPCCALLTARWAPTAAASCFALGLAVLVSIPDQIVATVTQYAFLAALAVVSLTAVLGAAVLQRQHP
jgi:Sodium/calcium exchanger protein